MVGVIVLSLGMPALFASLDEGQHFGGGVMVLGYVIMRVAMAFLWFRAARDDPRHRATCLTYAILVLVAQAGWSALILADPTLPAALAITVLFVLVEFAAPVIALGEGVIGTVASVSAAVESQGWSLDAIMIAAAGIGLTFSMWWIYFLIGWGEALHRDRSKAFYLGCGHLPLFGSIAAVGAGLHVTALQIEHKVHIVQLAVAMIAIAASVVMAAMGFGITACLAVLTGAPAFSIVTNEVLANRLYGET